MPHSWLEITPEHVIAAIEKFDADQPKCPGARSTFLQYNDKQYPAKHIRGMAYEQAFGAVISKEAFSGGQETIRFFEKLGFTMVHTASKKSASTGSRKVSKTRPVPARKKLCVVDQKNALQKLLQRQFGIMETEKKFTWMKTPSLESMSGEYEKIYNALAERNGRKDFFKQNYRLACDFFFEEHNLIVEYDEQQHFTALRKIALENYPDSLALGFSKDVWVRQCALVNAQDNHPPGRDEGRAFYDTVRDLEAARSGCRLVRIRHGEVDWSAEDAAFKLQQYFYPVESAGSATDALSEVADESTEFDWRSLEIALQQVRLNYLKWLFFFTPPEEAMITGCDKGDDFTVLDSAYGRSFTVSPGGMGSVYVGGGRGCIGLPEDCYPQQEQLTPETDSICASLDSMVQKLKERMKQQLKADAYADVWNGLMNFWWLKLGLHEYAYDVVFETNNVTPSDEKDLREFILETLRRGVDKPELLPERFSDEKILHHIQYNFKWNRFACCAFDCGPIAFTRGGYLDWTAVVAQRLSYDAKNASGIEQSDLTGMDLHNARREYAVSSLETIYEFPVLYHRAPLGDVYRFKDFLKNKRAVRELIRTAQKRLNTVIREEALPLDTFDFVPK